VDAFPAEQNTDAAHQIDGADDCAARAVDFAKWLERGRLALSPEPNLRGRPPARLAAGRIHRMAFQDRAASLHQRTQQVAARAARQMLLHGPVRYVMRRLGFGLRRKRRYLPGAIHQAMPVAHAGMKLQPARAVRGRTAESARDGLNKLPALFTRDVPGS